MIKIKYILILFLTFKLIDCKATNEPRLKWTFLSKNGIYVLKLSESKTYFITDKNEAYQVFREIKWGVYNTFTNKLKYEIPGPISQRSAYVSFNGNNIVIINDWPPEKADDNLDLILIYRKGKLIANYKLSDLLNCGFNILPSNGHFKWIFGEFQVNFLTNQITFKTTELIDYKINIKTGKITKKDKDTRITKNSILVYGKILSREKGNYKLKMLHKIYGSIDSSGIIKFKSDYKFHDGSYYTVLINDGIEITVKSGLYDLRYLKFNVKKVGLKPKQFKFGNINCN